MCFLSKKCNIIFNGISIVRVVGAMAKKKGAKKKK
jgi:hypothetical protein